ncbi:MAG: hypothetical protein WC222_02510 [Parachlamydiales bacterium]
MKSLNTLLLCLTGFLLSSCCNNSYDPNCNPCPAPRPTCPQPVLDYNECCDDSGYSARPYLWEHY